MEAGRELDITIAEKVMGWPLMSFSTRTIPYVNIDGDAMDCPFFSTDIAAAWQVVEKTGIEGARVTVRQIPAGWTCSIEFDQLAEHYQYDADAPTAPLAICLAALKAVDHLTSASV